MKGTIRIRWVVPTLLVAAGACMSADWPLEGTMTSAFGFRWQGGPDVHRGVDISVPDGTPVRAMEDASVRFAGVMSGYGTVIWLDHGRDVLSVYAHLRKAMVREGARVRKGQVIAESGRSGNASGPHLHFEVWRSGKEQDPVRALGGFPTPLRVGDAGGTS